MNAPVAARCFVRYPGYAVSTAPMQTGIARHGRGKNRRIDHLAHELSRFGDDIWVDGSHSAGSYQLDLCDQSTQKDL